MSSFLTELNQEQISSSVVTDAANIILAYSITALFLVKNKGVVLSREHYDTLISQYLSKGSVNFSSFEAASNTHDQISLIAPSTDEVKNYVLRDNAIADTIITFLNEESSFNALVSQITNNGIINRIVIDVKNMSVDEPTLTGVLIDNDMVNVFTNFMPIYNTTSTDSSGIGQKELKKDYGYENHRKFINHAFGIDMGPDSGVYYQTAHNNDNPTVESLEGATRQLYQDICRKINDGFSGQFDSLFSNFKRDLMTQMMKCCYGITDESECKCIIIGDNECTDFDVDEMFNGLENAQIEAKCPDHINPSIRIVDTSKNELFQLRFKKEKYKGNLTGHRYKMYFKPSNLKKYFKG